jgi:hypothetical protein
VVSLQLDATHLNSGFDIVLALLNAASPHNYTDRRFSYDSQITTYCWNVGAMVAMVGRENDDADGCQGSISKLDANDVIFSPADGTLIVQDTKRNEIGSHTGNRAAAACKGRATESATILNVPNNKHY